MSNIGSIAATAVAAAGGVQGPGVEAAKPESGGSSFAQALEDAARSAVETLDKAETVSMDAAAGDAEILDVVTAVNDAEATLRTAVSIRDKVVQSYQEILRMPI